MQKNIYFFLSRMPKTFLILVQTLIGNMTESKIWPKGSGSDTILDVKPGHQSNQSRSQSPQAPRSAVSRRVKLWGNGIFYPRIRGFRLLCACLAGETEVKKSEKSEGSGVSAFSTSSSGDKNGVSVKIWEFHSLDVRLNIQLVKSSGSTLLLAI